MKLDTWLMSTDLKQMGALVQAAEGLGFAGLWASETSSDAFLPLVLAAEHSERIEMGTAIAVAFPRSPTVLAHIGWDLARFSKGRFIMGLGSQVKAHNERRLGVKWEKPVRKMRETIEAMRAIWHTWQTGDKLRYEGEFFRLTLMTPFFSGGKLDVPPPPIYISAVNKLMLKLAGKACDGVHIHPFHSALYLDQFAWPHIREGFAASGRERADFTAASNVFVVPTDGRQQARHYEQFARQQLAFYMSTPAYRVMMDLHGWTEIGEQLSVCARRGEWGKMPGMVTDEMLDALVVTGKWGELPGKIRDRYGDLLDRVSFYMPFVAGQEDDGWRAAIAGFAAEPEATA